MSQTQITGLSIIYTTPSHSEIDIIAVDSKTDGAEETTWLVSDVDITYDPNDAEFAEHHSSCIYNATGQILKHM